MSLVINTNEQATRIHGVYNRNNTQMNAAMTRVATAQKINSARDGASMWAISEKMRERIRANDQANQNVQNDTALLKTAQEGMSNTLDILKTLKERAINSANDSNIGSDRNKIVEEVKQLVAQIDDNAAKVKFNGRALLNGATDPTSGSVSGVSTTSATAVTASGNYGDKAVYGITNLYKVQSGTGASSVAAITGDTALVDLRGSNGEVLFQAGDKITVSWTENGVAKESALTIAAASKFADLTGPGSWSFKDKNEDTGALDANGGAVSAPAAGVYFVGAAGKNISDLAISVTKASGATNTAGQAALQPIAVQQSYGDGTKGSNMVFSLAVTAATGADNDNAAFWQVVGGTDATATKGDIPSAKYELTIGDKKIEFGGSESLNAINDKLNQAGINVRMHYAASGDTLNYDGQTVTKGTYGASVNYTASSAGLYFVGAAGENIGEITFGALTSSNVTAKSTSNTGEITRQLSLDDTSAVGGSSSSNTLPQGQALQFYIGGEANFGVNFAIGKATAQTLLGSSVDAFGNKFQTKEGAESAIEIIDNAINKTLTEQTRLGAMEARLGYTSDNLVTMNENLEAANSAIRDADIAREMTNYMKFAVLSQSSQYMLAQAGQNAYQVLNLLNA